MAGLFQEITKSHPVKVCLSSRPWVVFQEAYRFCPSLRLQDLTYHDIKIYVDGKFDSNTAFRRLAKEDPDSAGLLRKEVIVRADGVFLWVQIVLKSLLDGIRNRDDIDILRERLERMPRELESLYRHLLGLIDPVYMIWASKAFQIARAVQQQAVTQNASSDRSDAKLRMKLFESDKPAADKLDLASFFLAMTEKPFSVDVTSDVSLCDQVYENVRTFTESLIMTKSKTHRYT